MEERARRVLSERERGVLGVVAWMSGTTVAAFYGAAVLAATGLPVLLAWRRKNPSIA